MNGKHSDLSFSLSDIHSDVHGIVTVNNINSYCKSFPYLQQKSKLKYFEQEVCVYEEEGGGDISLLELKK